MISPKDAYKKFQNSHKNLDIKYVLDLPPKYYMFCAIEKGLKTDVNDPYYAMDKNTEKIYNYSPADDLDNFDKAREKGPLKV